MTLRLLILSLIRQYLPNQPMLIQILHLIHILSQITQINELQVSDSNKGFLGEEKGLGEEGFNSKGSPVLLGYTNACYPIRHFKILLLQKPIKST